MEYKKKLIEVALPLDVINSESAREKSIRHGHPSTLHLWWSRKPTATARAVIFASLVDDPSSLPEQFPTEEKQIKERQRLFKIIERLVTWENANKQDVISEAKTEIMKSTNGNPPALLDPFAGGGSIPLEAQRLGLVAYANDLNPVAVMINKAMIEIPPKFSGMSPVNPESSSELVSEWFGAAGLAEDVRYYGEWVKSEALKRIGHLYPKVKVPLAQGGGEATVIAWLWYRTVKCPNPVCGCSMPLTNSFDLTLKKGNESYVDVDFVNGVVKYTVKKGKSPRNGTVNRKGATCIFCGSPVSFSYIRNEGRNQGLGSTLVAIVAESRQGRLYLSANDEHADIAQISRPDNYPNAQLPKNPRDFKTPNYGIYDFADLFTNRQLTTLSVFSDLIKEVEQKVYNDAIDAGYIDDSLQLNDGGVGARAYAQAICVYLSFALDKLADYNSSICSWLTLRDGVRNTFARQAIPMVWNFTEANPFSNSSGCWDNMLDWVYKALGALPGKGVGKADQFDAQSDNGLRNIMISTDPPYYDNIGYADLSDFFYLWLRRTLIKVYPEIFKTMLVPKVEELIATPYRFDGSEIKAREYFENGMLRSFEQVYKYSSDDIPVTIYYAFKQTETEESESSNNTSSTGWEAMLSAIIQAGFTITGTWPIRTEMMNRPSSIDANALASSIVLVCRKRPVDAPVCTRRDFINTLKRELRPALQKLQASNIAPVDLAQSAIGPGMAVYSRFSRVLEADGSPMSVRSALQIINQELDLYFSEQDGELDRDSRFCVDLFSQYAFNEVKFGEADVLARAKNTSVEKLAKRGILYAQKGMVRLLTREEIPEKVESQEQIIWLLTQQLTRAIETGGIVAAAKIIADMFSSNAENAKALAYRLFTIAERKGWAGEAYAYNSLVIAWPDIQSKAAELKAQMNNAKQMTLFDTDI